LHIQDFTAQFRDSRRLELMGKLGNLIGDMLPLIWASLWTSDLKCLEDLVLRAQEHPGEIRYALEEIALGSGFISKCV
jgi:hypothetical protein